MIRRTSALVLALVLAAVLSVPAQAASASSTADLVPGPPTGTWQAEDAQTGSLTAADLYGSSASSVNGFGDAYRRVWSGTDQVLLDRVEHFTSVFWAAFRYGESSGAASGNASHASYKTIPSFSPQAYETTDAADAQGFLADTIVFTKGDYLAVVELAAKVSTLHEVLLDQATRQLARLPLPTQEYQSLGYGILLGGGALLIVVLAVMVGIVVLMTRRRRPPVAAFAGVPAAPAPGVPLSPDGRFWWDGQAWQDTALSIPPGSPRSPDGSLWWDGARWRPAPPGR
jgi:hypothetical protein